MTQVSGYMTSGEMTLGRLDCKPHQYMKSEKGEKVTFEQLYLNISSEKVEKIQICYNPL